MSLRVLPTDARQLFPVAQMIQLWEAERPALSVEDREELYARAAQMVGKPHNVPYKGNIINPHLAYGLKIAVGYSMKFMSENSRWA